ncbi:HlyD family secretion protein [Massilia sp. DWR3-1-1]|uniref:HlyD family secretion protein n=1 Tax=Massilia sp. DWR3-1-1 TaxID=2804559 RepID=UPI003CF10C8C
MAGASLAALLAIGVGSWYVLRPSGPGPGFVSGNGRIEATETDVATRVGGRVDTIVVREGDVVQAGQLLATMRDEPLMAQRDEARARQQQASDNVGALQAQVAMRQSEQLAASAVVRQRASDLDAARRRLARSERLAAAGAASVQELDRARVGGAEAVLAAAVAQVDAAAAAIGAARAQVVGARSAVVAALATTARVDADITDNALRAPAAGRVQYRVAEPGEVLAAGGKVLNLVDLGDVYLTFFLPEAAVGKLAIGSEVRLVLDGAPVQVLPATISFVASTAQFTPKTVETASERQRLMFRVKAQLGRALLLRQQGRVKPGLPGVAWVRLDAAQPWPAQLALTAAP